MQLQAAPPWLSLRQGCQNENSLVHAMNTAIVNGDEFAACLQRRMNCNHLSPAQGLWNLFVSDCLAWNIYVVFSIHRHLLVCIRIHEYVGWISVKSRASPCWIHPQFVLYNLIGLSWACSWTEKSRDNCSQLKFSSTNCCSWHDILIFGASIYSGFQIWSTCSAWLCVGGGTFCNSRPGWENSCGMDSDFPLREADVSMVRVNLSDSAQVQDLIVKIVDCLEIFPSFWRGCKHRQTRTRYNQIMSNTSRWRHLGCSSCKGEFFLVHRGTQCRKHHCTEMAMPVLVTCIATVFFWGFAPPAGHSDIGVIAIWLCKCHFDGRKYAKSL